MKRKWICGIDLGSGKIAGVVGRLEGSAVTLFGAAAVESSGIARGVVTDLGSVSSAVRELVDQLESQSKFRLETALLAFNGAHLECQNFQSSDFITERAREITSREVRHVLGQAQTVSFPMNRQLLHVLLQGYVVDGQGGIQNPIGMYAARLRVQLLSLTGIQTFIQNAVTCVNRAGLDVEALVFSGYATALAVLGRENRRGGCAFLEIGDGLSSFLVFQGGGVTHLQVFPFGGELVTESIAEQFQISKRDAKLLKEQQGTLLLPETAASHELLIGDGSRQKVIRKGELCEVIQRATQRLFEDIRKGTKDLPFPNNTLVLSGGGSLLEGMADSAGEYLKCHASVGSIQELSFRKPLPPSFATAVGLLRYGAEKQKEQRLLLPEGPVGRVLLRLRELFFDYF
ncbi:MAG: cell division protein FtsA [Candidatus Omnitrophota bacterium]